MKRRSSNVSTGSSSSNPDLQAALHEIITETSVSLQQTKHQSHQPGVSSSPIVSPRLPPPSPLKKRARGGNGRGRLLRGGRRKGASPELTEKVAGVLNRFMEETFGAVSSGGSEVSSPVRARRREGSREESREGKEDEGFRLFEDSVPGALSLGPTMEKKGVEKEGVGEGESESESEGEKMRLESVVVSVEPPKTSDDVVMRK